MKIVVADSNIVKKVKDCKPLDVVVLLTGSSNTRYLVAANSTLVSLTTGDVFHSQGAEDVSCIYNATLNLELI